MKENNPIRMKEIWVIMFLLGNVMINFPFIHIFNKNITLGGFPLLFVYFMVGWPLSIFVVYLFSSRIRDDAVSDDEDQGKGGA